MRLFWYDLFILSCIYLDVILVVALLGSSVHSFASMLSLLVVPVAFSLVSGSAFAANRLVTRSKEQKPFRFKEVMVIGSKKKEKKALVEKKVLKPLQTSKPKVEFGFHTCPVHGIEKCAGNYLDLHSCNETSNPSSKQIFWKEVTPALPAK
jgi:hypothetical protein